MRDIFKPDGLREKIGRVISAIPIYMEYINNSTEISQKKGNQRMLLNILLQKTIAHYSVGDDKATVKEALLETIPAFVEAFEYETGSDYEDALWMVSLGILCDVSSEEFKKITDILLRDKVNDALISEIIRYKQSDWQASSAAVLWQKPYALLVDANSTQSIKQYLDKHWYQENEESYWHNLHKNTKVNNYFGYWSWETAALVKARGIDDSSLKTQKYYPYDAVHW
jgi:hypothetical protein